MTARARPDGRSAPARRYRKLVDTFVADLGAEPTAAERQLIEQAAIVSLKAEQMRSSILAGADVPADDLVRLSNSATRILNALRTKQKRGAALDLHSYLAGRTDIK